MEHKHFNWPAVLTIAERLGVSKWTRIKWKQRNAIPPRWHLALIAESGGSLTASDFLPAPETKAPSVKKGAK